VFVSTAIALYGDVFVEQRVGKKRGIVVERRREREGGEGRVRERGCTGLPTPPPDWAVHSTSPCFHPSVETGGRRIENRRIRRVLRFFICEIPSLELKGLDGDHFALLRHIIGCVPQPHWVFRLFITRHPKLRTDQT